MSAQPFAILWSRALGSPVSSLDPCDSAVKLCVTLIVLQLYNYILGPKPHYTPP